MTAALTALAFGASKKVGVIHVGDYRAYRKRQGRLEALTEEHLRPASDGGSTLTRILGADKDIQADFIEAEAEIFDRFILVSPGPLMRLEPGQLAKLLSLDLAAEPMAQRIVAEAGGEATAVVVDILALPDTKFDDIAAAYADLPVLPPPQRVKISTASSLAARSIAVHSPCSSWQWTAWTIGRSR
jgi:hypothetical protein